MSGADAKHGMTPIGARDARLLILGSLPGDESIRQQQYYAHPQNQFWRILCAVFDKPYATAYAERLALLERHHIAVWDVLHSARRRGSLDGAITAPAANNFADFLAHQPHIAAIAFNGQKAAALFKSCIVDSSVIARAQTLRSVTLPSTSPAAAMIKLDQKIEKWRDFLLADRPNLNPAARRDAAQQSGSTSRR